MSDQTEPQIEKVSYLAVFIGTVLNGKQEKRYAYTRIEANTPDVLEKTDFSPRKTDLWFKKSLCRCSAGSVVQMTEYHRPDGSIGYTAEFVDTMRHPKIYPQIFSRSAAVETEKRQIGEEKKRQNHDPLNEHIEALAAATKGMNVDQRTAFAAYLLARIIRPVA